PVFLQRTARTETPAVPQSVPLQMCDGFWSDFPQESPPCFPIQIQPPPGLPRECHRSCIFQFQDSELLQDSPGETVPPKTSYSTGGYEGWKTDKKTHNKEHQVEKQPSDAPLPHSRQKSRIRSTAPPLTAYAEYSVHSDSESH